MISEERTLVAIAPGVVELTATIGNVSKSVSVRIWKGIAPSNEPRWEATPLGTITERNRSEKSLPDDPDLYFIDKTNSTTFVRAFTENGIQLWITRIPDPQRGAQFLCEDHQGGVLVIIRSSDRYTVYSVSSKGKLAWSYSGQGVQKSHALAYDETLYLVEAQNATAMTVLGIDGSSGQELFRQTLPQSDEEDIGFEGAGSAGTERICVTGASKRHAKAFYPSNLFVNPDGRARLAFTKFSMRIAAPKCKDGEAFPKSTLREIADVELVLWKINSRGEHIEISIERRRFDQIAGKLPMFVPFPTGELTHDGANGVLLSVVDTPCSTVPALTNRKMDEFVYHVAADDSFTYKLALPEYTGPRADTIALKDEDPPTAFAARGTALIAFDVETGIEIWRWDSRGPTVRIGWVTDDGDIDVYLSDRIVQVHDGTHQKEIFSPHSEN